MAIRFDISQIPATAAIREAILSIYFFYGDMAEPGKPNVCTLFTISKPWIDDEITWDNAQKNMAWEMTDYDTKFYNSVLGDTVVSPGGGDYSREHSVTGAYVDTNAWEKYDVTGILNKMVRNQIDNHGFLIKQFICPRASGPENKTPLMNDGKSYRSSEYEETEKRPRLSVTYEQTSIQQACDEKKRMNIRILPHSRGNVMLFVPRPGNHPVTIHDINGKRLSSCVVQGEMWASLPAAPAAAGIYIVTIESSGRAIHRTLFLSTR